MKRIVIFGIIGVVVIAGVFAVMTAAFTPREYLVASTRKGPIEQTVYATGFIEARERRVLRAQRAAVVAQIFARDGRHLREGDEVRKDEPILRLRDSALEARKRAAQTEVSRLGDQSKEDSPYRKGFELRIAEAAQLAADERAREVRLAAQLPGGGISKDQYELARTRAITAEEREKFLRQDYQQALDNLRSAKESAEAILQQIGAQEKDDLIVSPLPGVILRLPLEEGEFAASGAELAMVGDIRELVIEAEVNEDDISLVRVDQAVNIRLAGNTDVRVKGQVFEILPDADRATKGYLVKVKFTEGKFIALAGSTLRGHTDLNNATTMSGMTAELGIVVKHAESGMVFARAALTPDNTVFVVKDGRVTETRVTLGLHNFEWCEAKSGLGEGDEVVVSDVRSLKDGARVKVKGKP